MTVPGSQRNETPSTAELGAVALGEVGRLRSWASAWRCAGRASIRRTGHAGQTKVDAGDRPRSLVAPPARDAYGLQPDAARGARPGGGGRRRHPRPALPPRLDRRQRVLPARAAASAALVFGNVEKTREPARVADLRSTSSPGSIACCLLWWRRRWPVHVAVVLALIGAFSSFSAGAACASRCSRSPCTGASRSSPRSPPWAWRRCRSTCCCTPRTNARCGRRAFVVLITGGIDRVGHVRPRAAPARRSRCASGRERAEAEQQLRVEQARQHERARIAREMHDVLAHRISLLSMHAGALEFRPDAPPEEIARAAGVVRESAHQALRGPARGHRRAARGRRSAARPSARSRRSPTCRALLDESREAGMRVSSECARGGPRRRCPTASAATPTGSCRRA